VKEKPIQDNSADLPPPSPAPQQVAPSGLAQPFAPQQDTPGGSPQPPQLGQPAATPGPYPQQSQPLKIEISHSERLDPVAPELRAGAVFNEQLLPPAEPGNDWYWIPYWYAGLKHVDTETDWQDYNFQTGVTINPDRVLLNRQDLAIGFQADRNGQVWEFKRAPYRATIEGQNTVSIMMVRNRDPLLVSQERVVIRLLQTAIIVDKASNRILSSGQTEQINTYFPSGPGVMTLQSSIKTFGADGSPQLQELNSGIVADRAPFQPIDYYEGHDMRALFSNYMLSHGYGNLLPDYLRPQAEH
jgi:hypothetical protein